MWLVSWKLETYEERLPAWLEKVEMKSKDIRRWTQDEDELLRAAIGKYGE